MSAKLGTGKTSQGIEGYGGAPLWTRRPALGCDANEGEEVLSVVLLVYLVLKHVTIYQGRKHTEGIREWDLVAYIGP